MATMRFAGTIYWVVEMVLLLWYLYEARNTATRKGLVLKLLASFGIVGYACMLIVMSSQIHAQPISRNSILFVLALLSTSLGDLVLGILPLKSEKRNVTGVYEQYAVSTGVKVGAISAGVFFVGSFFFQMVVFIKGISGELSSQIVPFLMFFLLPPLFTFIGGLLSGFRVPDVSTEVFIIGVFYILLTSAVYAATSLYAFNFYAEDALHASFISIGGTLFFLSTLMLSLRYSRHERYDTPGMRTFARALNFLARMILAGCAFLL